MNDIREVIHNEAHDRAIKSSGLKKHLEIFIRTGKVGTCGSCPVLVNGVIASELCEYRDRYDHNLAIEHFFQYYKNDYETQKKILEKSY